MTLPGFSVLTVCSEKYDGSDNCDYTAGFSWINFGLYQTSLGNMVLRFSLLISDFLGELAQILLILMLWNLVTTRLSCI